MAMPKTVKSLGRFLKNIFKHPGTWILGSLIAVGVGIAMPAIAPVFVLVALVSSIIAVPTLLLQAKNFWDKHYNKERTLVFHVKVFWNDLKRKFIRTHPIQFAAVLLALGLLVTALVLTIGFFTGGVGFAFMAPLFAAISAPFSAAATSWGIPLCVPALAGFCLTIAALNLPNTLKRFLGWLDSFKYDAAIDKARYHKTDENIDWSNKSMASEKVTKLVENYGYPLAVTGGILTTIIANRFSSRFEEELEAARERIESMRKSEKLRNYQAALVFSYQFVYKIIILICHR